MEPDPCETGKHSSTGVGGVHNDKEPSSKDPNYPETDHLEPKLLDEMETNPCGTWKHTSTGVGGDCGDEEESRKQISQSQPQLSWTWTGQLCDREARLNRCWRPRTDSYTMVGLIGWWRRVEKEEEGFWKATFK